MPARKPQTSRPIDDPAEYQRFLDMAREVEADETPGALDRAFDKVVRPHVTERNSGSPQATPRRRKNGQD
jgi:cell fate (sporulation/competence/biofilm development) regulator YlbF (YheA/YmcA/DUF963 family)